MNDNGRHDNRLSRHFPYLFVLSPFSQDIRGGDQLHAVSQRCLIGQSREDIHRIRRDLD